MTESSRARIIRIVAATDYSEHGDRAVAEAMLETAKQQGQVVPHCDVGALLDLVASTIDGMLLHRVVRRIELAPLPMPHLKQLVADCLRRDDPEIDALARLVATKTEGNPFFVIQFLKSLSQEGLLRFDHDASRWVFRTDEIARAAQDTDLLIAECYFHDKPVKWHLNYPDITAHAGRVGARRLILTHMSREMLARAADVPEQCAYDGLVVTL